VALATRSIMTRIRTSDTTSKPPKRIDSLVLNFIGSENTGVAV
jgi:hypothetical protein